MPTASSHKALKTVLPKLQMLSREARFHVKVQSVLTEHTYRQYDAFHHLLAALPFDFSCSLLHRPGGHVAIQGDQYVRLVAEHDLFAGMRLYRQHAVEMLRGDDSRPWKCLGGSKFRYVNAAGEVQLCSQNRAFRKPLHTGPGLICGPTTGTKPVSRGVRWAVSGWSPTPWVHPSQPWQPA